MMRQLAWKEFREGRGIWLTMAGLGLAMVFLLPRFIDALMPGSLPDALDSAAAVALIVLAAAYGLVVGAMLLAGEREGRTQEFLDRLASRRDLWWHKAQIGALLVLAQGLFYAALTRFLPEAPEWVGLPLLLLVAVEGLIWGLLGGALCPNVLAAATVGAVLGVQGWGLTFLAAAMEGGGVIAVLTHVGIDALALGASVALYCRSERHRAPGHRQATRRPWLGPVGASLWLTWRQWWKEWLILTGLALVLGSLLGRGLANGWPNLTLLAGVLCGTALWSSEQVGGTRRFLTDQRLPLTTVWLSRTLVGLLAVVVVAFGLFVGPAFIVNLTDALQIRERQQLVERLGLPQSPHTINVPALVVIWGVYGFAVGQLFGLLCQKRVIAVILSLGVSVTLILPWLPSIVVGGLPTWQLLIGPALLILTTRLVLAAWGNEQLGRPRPVLALVLGGLLCVGWQAGCLAWRVVGIPDVGEPFDVAAYSEELTALEKRESAPLIRRSMTELEPRWRKGYLDASQLDPDKIGGGGDWLQSAAEKGWTAAPAGAEAWLDRQFEGEWYDLLHRGVHLPPGLMTDPRRRTHNSPLREVQECRSAVLLLTLRAHERQAGRKDETALGFLLDVLALSRQMRPGAATMQYLVSKGVEHKAADGLAFWAGGVRELPLLRKALAEVAAHEKSLPNASDILKAEYLIDRSTRLQGEAYQRWESRSKGSALALERALNQLGLLSLELPWECERINRLLHYEYGLGFRRIAASPSVDRAVLSSNLLGLSGLFLKIERYVKVGQCRIRALRLQLALVLFQREKGRPAKTLEELKPDYLAEVPVDPFTGRSFGYRLADDHWVTPDDPAQWILWSAGEDGIDNGGFLGSTHYSDLVFVVPRLR